ncbi:N-6 DNA methylase (plasmid) [Ampullimonas aquatilis]|uniref:N-6 DNA methylase n=1 Tax=Ampullimonas aquatilis TaxID=1341549 RepID=UPI003C784D5C
MDNYQKEFIATFKEFYRHRKHEVFRDFCELAATAISNGCDKSQFDVRESQYMNIVGKYEKKEVSNFPRLLALIVESLTLGLHDCLGELFMTMEMSDHWKGQFFTPFEVCKLMAEISFDGLSNKLKPKGFVTVSDPACGAGAMLIASANSMAEQGFSYQSCLHVTAQDIDLIAVHMAYIQLSLLNIPAVVIHGNSLIPEKTWSCWYTPAHIMGDWSGKLRSNEVIEPSLIQSENMIANQAQDELFTFQVKPTGKGKQISLF